MVKSTKEQLLSAASKLLDMGGQDAVTLRAVAERVGVSHNAPYRHFCSRSALLAAVAERVFFRLKNAFEDRKDHDADAETALRNASAAFIEYARKHTARYRLLFSDPCLLPEQGLKDAALGSFQAFNLIVSRCQQDGILPQVDTVRLMIYAALHGAIDLELGGRSSESKGLGSIESTVDLLFRLLKRVDVDETLSREVVAHGLAK